MNAAVGGEFGMKCGSHHVALSHQHWKAIALGHDFNTCSDRNDARGADEDHLQRPPGKLGLGERSIW